VCRSFGGRSDVGPRSGGARCHDQNSKVARELTPPCAMSPGTQTQAPHGDAATIVAARKIAPDRKQAMPPLERATSDATRTPN
jgi:hypothetical protein